MPRFLRLQDKMIYVPSLSSVTVMTSCFGYPTISLSYHAVKSPEYIYYIAWDKCQLDFNRVKNALNEVDNALSKITLTEPELEQLNNEVQKNMIDLGKSIDEMDKLVKEELYPNKGNAKENSNQEKQE